MNIRNILAKNCLDNFFMQGRILYDCYLIFISGVGGDETKSGLIS